RTGCSGRHRKSGSNWTILIQNDCTMATIKTKFRSSSVEGREGTLYFQVIHGRVARQINTGYRLFPSEWDGRTSEIILPVSGDARRSLLLALKERMEKDIRRLESIIAG